MFSDNPKPYRFSRPIAPTTTGWRDASQVSTPILWLVIIVVVGVCVAPVIGRTS